ncbi:MAG: ATP-binding protein [Verrucomicrobiota bacterium JB022]|nr:ATP-binding protein [Verrucomicrobiota bacterium JB022]
MAESKRHDPLENVLGRIDDLDQASLGILVKRLARERRLLNSVFNTLREGLLVIDASGIIEYANASACQMLGFHQREVGKLSLWKAVPDLTRTLRFGPGGQLREENNLTRELQLNYPEKRLVRLYIVNFEDELAAGTAVAQYAVILSDVTQEKTQTQQEIETARVRSIIQLSAGVAHELGNPLNSLNIHLQVMKRQLDKMSPDRAVEKLQRSLHICQGEVERLDGIIAHFLHAVRPQAPDFSELNLVRVLEESLEVMGPELESAGIKVDVELGAKVPLIDGDRQQVKQVLFNLLKNARQAMKDGGTIRIWANSDDDFVYLQVLDEGEGIADEDLPKVFQPYFSTKAEGHGLGMMICERIMRDHGGQIGINSRVGVGTAVTLQFPQKHRRVRMLEMGS